MAEGEEAGHGFNRHWFVKKEKAVEYECCHCRNILDDPWQITVCGHQFCKLCLPAEIEKCPACHVDLKKDQIFPDESVRQKILAWIIKCPCKGCNWKGSLKVFQEEHRKECSLQLVTCSNEGCTEILVQNALPTHLQKDCLYRKEKCRYCSTDIVSASLKDHLEKTCHHYPVDCPQQCAKQIPREQIKNHVKDECEMTTVDCVCKIVGCEIKPKRRDVKTHEHDSMPDHLRLAMAGINNINEEKKEMGNTIKELRNENNDLRKELEKLAEDQEKRMTELEDNMKQIENDGAQRLDAIQKATEQNFDTGGKLIMQNEEFKDSLALTNDAVADIKGCAVAQLIEDSRSHTFSIWKLNEEQGKLRKMSLGLYHHLAQALKDANDEIHTRIDKLARQHEAANEKAMCFQENTERRLDLIDQAVKKNADDVNTQTQSMLVYKDDTEEQFRNVSLQMQRDYEDLVEKMSNEKQASRVAFQELSQEVAQLKMATLRHGSSLWKIDNVDSAIKMAAVDPKEAMYGEPFLSWPNGYLIRPKIFLNGARQKDRSYISVFAQILKGPNDALLQWPFGHRIRFTLVEQRGGVRNRRDIQRDLLPHADSEEQRRPTDEANNGYGIYKFVEHDVLRSANYVVDDTMFVRVEILAREGDERHSETI